MIARVVKGVYRGCLVYVHPGYSNGKQVRVTVLEGCQTLIPDAWGCSTKGLALGGESAYVNPVNLDKGSPKTIKLLRRMADGLELVALGKPDKAKQKEILRCVPV